MNHHGTRRRFDFYAQWLRDIAYGESVLDPNTVLRMCEGDPEITPAQYDDLLEFASTLDGFQNDFGLNEDLIRRDFV